VTPSSPAGVVEDAEKMKPNVFSAVWH